MKNSNIIKICLLITVIGTVLSLFKNPLSLNLLINAMIIFVATYLLILFAQLIFTVISISINQKKGFEVKPIVKEKKSSKKSKRKKGKDKKKKK